MLSLQIAGIGAILLSFEWLKRRAILRGQNRQPIPGISTFPIVQYLDQVLFGGSPIFLSLFLIYTIPYTDLTETNAGRSFLFLRGSFFLNKMRSYFSLLNVRTATLSPKETYIFGLHPHGLLPFGGFSSFLASSGGDNSFTSLFPGIEVRLLVASFCFFIPIYRDILLGLGAVDASRFSADRVLESGYSVVVVPGGATEALYSSPDEDILILRKRKGLIRLAAAHGSSLVPVFCFNENDVYDQFSIESKFVRTMKEHFQKIFGISLPFPKNIIPKAAKITCVYGTPIKVAKNLQPTEQFISSYQMQYIETVEELYKEYGPKYNSKLKKLIIK